jgi:hypothetical protein
MDIEEGYYLFRLKYINTDDELEVEYFDHIHITDEASYKKAVESLKTRISYKIKTVESITHKKSTPSKYKSWYL